VANPTELIGTTEDAAISGINFEFSQHCGVVLFYFALKIGGNWNKKVNPYSRLV